MVDLGEGEVFPPHVDTSGVKSVQETPRKGPQKTFEEVQSLIQGLKKAELKQLLRENQWPLDSPIRPKLWKVLCLQHAREKNTEEGFYWNLVNQMFGSADLPERSVILPGFVENRRKERYHLEEKGRRMVERVICILGFTCPDITYSPTAYPIASLLLHYMEEEDCYNCLIALVGSKVPAFILQTKLLDDVTWRTVMNITKKYAKSAAAHLSRHCSATRAETIFSDWVWWIFDGIPFHHLVRVMDCYLNEGIKVLYRVAMALLILFQKYSSVTNSQWSKTLQEAGLDFALKQFCSNLPVTPRKLLRTAFGIRSLSSGYIQKVFLKTEMTMKSQSRVRKTPKQLIRSFSSENLPDSQSVGNIQMMSHTLTIREVRDTLFTLWSWLPMRITMYQPVLLYTTEEHGCSLTTFYFRVEHHEPTLLMIKTINDEVFGAYCSSRWMERNQRDERGNRTAYFGTGETFLFSLQPRKNKYPWVGIDTNVDHSAELFMAADSSMITIGGGEGQAIWMDENIRFGKTDHCLTFNNPPLCESGDFEIRVLEVYGFGSST